MIAVRSIAIGDRVWYTDSDHVYTHNGPTPGCKSGLGTVQAIDDWGGVAVVKMDNGEKIGAMFPEVQSIISGRMTFRTKTDSELADRNGETVDVRFQHPSDEPKYAYDIDDVGVMYRIRFSDGFETTAFEDELADC